MTTWNPSSPSVLGPEFFPALAGARTPITTGHVAQRFESLSAETIASVRLHVAERVLSPDRTYLVEIVADADLLTAGEDDLGTDEYQPNAQASIVGSVTDAGGATTNLWTDIDEGSASVSYADYLVFGAGSSIDWEFGTASYIGAGRIVAVALLVTNARTGGTTEQNRQVCSIVSGGVAYGPITKVLPNNNAGGTAGRAWFNWGEINPVTGRPWTAAELLTFDTGALRVRMGRQAGDPGTQLVAAASLVVVYETTERRQAIAVLPYSGVSNPAWTTGLSVTKPDGTANWSKAATTVYRLTVREAARGDLGVTSPATALRVSGLWSVQGTGAPEDLEGDDVVAATTIDQGVVYTHAPPLAVLMPTTSARSLPGSTFLAAFALVTTAPAVSDDGQPYTSVDQVEVHTSSGATEGQFRTPTSDDFATIRLVAGHNGTPPDAELAIEVRRRSDGVLMGTARVQPDAVDTWVVDSTFPAVVEAVADAPMALASGTAYYFNPTSTTAADRPWLIALLAGDSTYEGASYRTATDRADPIEGAAATGDDLAMVIDSAVAAPTNFAATAATDPLPDTPPADTMTGVPLVELTWDASALGVLFGSYELQRQHPDLGWQTIASITDEAVAQFNDYEGRLGVQECYRMRLVQADGSASFYTDTECATAPTGGCGYTFTTNESPELNVAYPDMHGSRSERTYGFPEADEVQFRTMHGRDHQVAFRPLTRRGVAFERRLAIAGMAAPAAGVGPPAADLLRDLAWATLSYVAVRDQHGNRWYANINVPSMAVLAFDNDGAHYHQVQVQVVEVTDTPSVPDAIAP